MAQRKMQSAMSGQSHFEKLLDDTPYLQMDIWTAASLSHFDIVKRLLYDGTDVNGLNASGWSPLHYAAYLGHSDMAMYLLDSGARINQKTTDSENRTALMLASSCGNESVVEKLLKRAEPTAADVSLVDNHGHSALYYAVYNQHERTANLLLEANAPPDTPDNNGYTPLMIASKANCTNIVKILLAKRANANITAFNKKDTAYSLATAAQADNAVALLDQHRENSNRNNFIKQRHLLGNNQTINDMVANNTQRRDSMSRNRRAGCVTASTTLLVSGMHPDEVTPTKSNAYGAQTVIKRSTTRANEAPSLNATTASTASTMSAMRACLTENDPLPTDLFAWLVQKVGIHERHYEELRLAYPNLTVAKFITLTDSDLVGARLKLGPRVKMAQAIKSYNEKVNKEKNMEITPAQAHQRRPVSHDPRTNTSDVNDNSLCIKITEAEEKMEIYRQKLEAEARRNDSLQLKCENYHRVFQEVSTMLNNIASRIGNPHSEAVIINVIKIVEDAMR